LTSSSQIFEGEQPGLADDRKRAGQFHAETDLDRFHGARTGRAAADQDRCREQRARKVSHFEAP
jgi:hypothetical protein